MHPRTALRLVLPCLTVALASAQEPIDRDLNARIREEAFQRSQIMATLHQLTDVHSPRLTGSPSYRAAAQWAADQLKAWGLSDAHLEAWDWGHPGWTNLRCAAHAEAPWTGRLEVEPLAWGPSTEGTVRGAALLLPVPEEPTEAELTAILAAAGDAVKGRLVLAGALRDLPALNPAPMPLRHADEALAKRFDPAHPTPMGPRPQAPRRPGALEPRAVNERVDAFLLAHKALARINDAGLRHGQIRAFSNRTYDPARIVPTVVMRHEDYGRIARLLQDGVEVRLALEVANRLHPEGTKGLNVVADLPGSDKAGEVVLLGAHLDAWHTATGATDNGTGAAVMMEAGRILAAAGAKPRRTIRIALWDAEEHGLLGSAAYVKAHFGDAEQPLPGHGSLVAAFNVDSGAGQVRGLGLFGPPAGAQVLRELLAPFADLAVKGASASANRPSRKRPGPSSDSASFSAAGLPVINVVQDGLEYFEYTWHTAIDTLERVPPEDVKRTAAVLASVAWHLANREERLPFFGKDTLPPSPDAAPQPLK
ncbi:M20/M25/M40 family metallo-hydrolase [Mesoterricola sediminis]|uniref:Carboxypeptidase Q n=1 Tax=Mesoterricola sediminis TaxID=2927980 RepID=A0AA48KBP3_9BACT|nr:M20/M25/M40 family metallo-hydrolase [Mesoterricola sediminis]BDU76056.1 peptidase M28 [Mesoterricola sediminis]